jgi:hypothetical protein
VKATEGASSKLGALLDDLAATLIGGVSAALSQRVDGLVGELKSAIGAPATTSRDGARPLPADRQLQGYGESATRTGDLGTDRSRSTGNSAGPIGARAD